MLAWSWRPLPSPLQPAFLLPLPLLLLPAHSTFCSELGLLVGLCGGGVKETSIHSRLPWGVWDGNKSSPRPLFLPKLSHIWSTLWLHFPTDHDTTTSALWFLCLSFSGSESPMNVNRFPKCTLTSVLSYIHGHLLLFALYGVSISR